MLLITFYEPTLAVKLELTYGFTPDQAAFFYSIQTATSFFCTITFTAFPMKTQFINWTICGCIAAVIALSMFGPSNLLPDNIYLMAVGTVALGITISILGICTLLLLLERMKQAYPTQHDEVSKIAASARVMTGGFAFIIGPIYGSSIESAYGF